jgi:hypothetical protein
VTAGRPAAPEPRPGFAPFLVAFLLSPLVLACWAAAQGVIRVTGWPRWRVGAAAVASGALVIWFQGGPVPALAAHFSGYQSLLSQFGQPMLHLPGLGPLLWPQLALSVPAGLLAASLTRRTDLAVPDPAAATRAARREQRERRQARRLVGRVRSSETNSQANNTLGVSLGGDLATWQAGKYVVLPDDAARLPRLVLDRPGQGKSVYLAREAYLAGFAARQSIILDGKGDNQFTAAVVDAYAAGWQAAGHPGRAVVHLFPDEPLSVWQGSPAEQVNKLLGCWAWSIEAAYYREVCVLALRLACGQPGTPVASMGDLVARLDPAPLAKAWHGHPAEANLVKTLKDKLGDVQLRLANLAAAAGGLLDGQRSDTATSWSSASRRWPTAATPKRCSASSWKTSATGPQPARAAARPGFAWTSSAASPAAGRSPWTCSSGAAEPASQSCLAASPTAPWAMRTPGTAWYPAPTLWSCSVPRPRTSWFAWLARCSRRRPSTPPRMASGAAEHR